MLFNVVYVNKFGIGDVFDWYFILRYFIIKFKFIIIFLIIIDFIFLKI